MRKFTLENNLFFISCAAIFLLGIFLRSTIDIGPDTGIYLDIGKKIADGKKYYHDFFESNFPISFYIYALEYRLSTLLRIDPIITSEITINLLALLSIFWSAKILQGSEIYQNRTHYNLIIISYFLGFFLRPHALQLGEFGTKTSFLLILLFPYFSYSFPRRDQGNKVCLGILMGLIPCFKPHYIIFPLIVECYKFWQKKSVRFFFELDKLIAALIYISYLFLMLKFIPEFFEMIIPMWLKIYASYNSSSIFIENFSRLLAAHIEPYIFTFLIFTRLKLSESDRTLLVFFVAAILVFVTENAMTIDQSVIFYAVATTCLTKFSYDFIKSKKAIFSENKFILISLLFLPLFDLGIFPTAIFGLGGFINIWWLITPIIFYRQARKYFLVLVPLYLLGILILIYCNPWHYVAFNCATLFGILCFYERIIYAKISKKFSVFSLFVITASLSSMLYLYVCGVVGSVTHRNNVSFPNKMSDMMNYYAKEFAPQKDDATLMISTGNGFNFSRLNYLQKENQQKFHLASTQAGSVNEGRLMFDIFDKESLLVNYYLFDDIKSALKNPRTKIVFVNNSPSILYNKGERCLISSLEYYFSDVNFRKFFLTNYRFENHIIITHEIDVIKNVPFITGVKPSIFDQVTKSNQQILYDFEVYVRQ